ncbi:Pesticin receptor [compost metagenome]
MQSKSLSLGAVVTSNNSRRHSSAFYLTKMTVALIVAGGLGGEGVWAQPQPATGSGEIAANDSIVEEGEAVADGRDAADSGRLGTVVVRARNREERLQDIPVPVSVVSGDDLAREAAVTFQDIGNRAAGIIVNEQNARQSSIAIRGLGKQGATDGLEASVGAIVDNVFYGYGAMTWGSWIDVDRVEVLRGPQGTLLGKNTTLGVVNVFTKQPRFTPEASLEGTIGSRDSVMLDGHATGPLVDDTLAYRASFIVDKRPGAFENLNPVGGELYEKDRVAGRLQFLFTPNDKIDARIILGHAQSDEDVNGNLLLEDPTTFGDGTPRTGQTFTSRLQRVSALNGVTYKPPYGRKKFDRDYNRPLENEQNGVSAEINWQLDSHTFTSITAWNDLDFYASNDQDNTPFSVNYNFNTDATYRQVTQEFRLTSQPGGRVDYQIGLFGLTSKISTNQKSQYGDDAGAWYASGAQWGRLNANGAGRQLLRDSLDTVFTVQNQKPTTDSVAAFGQLNWHLTERADLTLGLRQTYEERDNSIDKRLVVPGSHLANDDATAQRYFGLDYATLSAAQRAQIQDAIDLRSARVGLLYSRRPGERISDTSPSWLVSPSYKLNDDTLLYASVSYGEKSGATLFDTTAGTPITVDPERAFDLGLGIKLSLLDQALTLNANLYQTTVKDYQQTIQKVDPTTISGFRGELGNVAEVRLRGLELDAAWRPDRHWTVRAAGAFNRGIYKSFDNATCSNTATATPAATCDFSGEQLPSAPRWTINLGLAYETEIGNGLLLRGSLNNAYKSSHNVDTGLNEYGEQEGYHVTDLSLRVGPLDDRYSFGVVVKNLFDTHYATNASGFTNAAPVSYRPGDPRWVGFTFRTDL